MISSFFISAASCQMDGRAMEEARQLCQGHKASATLDGKRKNFVRSATSNLTDFSFYCLRVFCIFCSYLSKIQLKC